MEAITQHSRQEGMTCDLINKTASVLKPKFCRVFPGDVVCLTDTGDDAETINKRIIVCNTSGIANQKQLHADTQAGRHREREREMWINIERDREHENIGRHSHKRRQRRARVALPKLRSIHVSGSRVFIFFLPPSPPIFTTLWK